MKDLHGVGARRIGVTSLPPLGCFPSALALFGFQGKGCVRTVNNHVLVFNRKLNSTAAALQKQLPGLKLVIFDVFKPLYDVIVSPSNHGEKSGSIHSLFFSFIKLQVQSCVRLVPKL